MTIGLGPLGRGIRSRLATIWQRQRRLVPALFLLLPVAIARATPLAPTAAVSNGVITVDGRPFLMIGAWGQCAPDVPLDLSLGINTFVDSLCDMGDVASAAMGDAYIVSEIDDDQDLPGQIGVLQPDEPDGSDIPVSELADRHADGSLTLMNVTMNVWKGSGNSSADYGAYFAKADILSVDVYPVEHMCDEEPQVTLETPYDVQLALSSYGKPSGQWLEANDIDGTCPYVLTPAMVQAEAWEVFEGGGTWIGWFFPTESDGAYTSFEVAPDIAAAITSVDAQIESLSRVILAPRLAVQTPLGNGLPSGPGSNPIKVGGRVYGGRDYILATNTTGSAVRWQYTLPGHPANAVLTVRNQAGVSSTATANKNGVVTATLQRYETRIVSWTPVPAGRTPLSSSAKAPAAKKPVAKKATPAVKTPPKSEPPTTKKMAAPNS